MLKELYEEDVVSPLADDEYVETHRHSTYSIYDGCGRPAVAATYAAHRGQVALGLTDHGGMGGQAEHWKACKAVGIKPLCGVEAYFQPDFDPELPDYHMTILVKTQQGWENVCRMLTEANQSSFYRHARVTRALLEKYHEGLIVASGCVGGYIPQLLLTGEHKTARKEAAWFSELFGADYYFEVMPFAVMEGQINIQKIVNLGVIALAKINDRRVLMSSDAHYIEKEEYDTYLLLAEIAKTKLIADYSNLYMHSAQEMADAWEAMMGTDGRQYVRETRRMADTIEDLELHFTDMTPSVVWEKPSNEMLLDAVKGNLQLMGKWDLSDEQEEALFCSQERMSDRALSRHERLAAQRDVVARLKASPYAARVFHEYDVITHVDFVDYFLIMYDIARFAREHGIKCSARGSVCGSLIAHALWISQVDPITTGTYFEKFMRKDKKVPPDIDMDFDPRGRKLIFEYVFAKYPGRAAHISNYGYFKVKSLINEMVKRYPAISLEHSIGLKIRLDMINYQGEPVPYEELLQHPTEGAYFQRFDALYPTFLDKFTRLFGQIKFLGLHAAGLMITKNEISSYLPLQWVAGKKEFQTAFDMKSIDTIGGMKFDLLGLTMLSIVATIERATGCSYDPAILDDPEIYEQFCAGNTEGIFQFGASRGIKDLLRKVKPQNFQELIAVNAMYRPGPLTSGIIDHYVSGKNGTVNTSAPWYPLTTDTYGVIVYQEQAMWVCTKLAKMTWDQTDKMTKGISKKVIPPEIEQAFLHGLVEHAGMSVEQAEALYESIKLYSFNKNHSASYTQIAVYNMWMRIHYPTEFWWATLCYAGSSSKLDNKARMMESAAFRHGQMILLPHMNGGYNYEIVERNGERFIRAGMRTIDGVGPGTAQKIEAMRAGCPYTDTQDLIQRVPKRSLNTARLEAMVKAGATIDLATDWADYERRSIHYCSQLAKGGR